MNRETIIEMNKKGWDELIKVNKPFANTILPEYGPCTVIYKFKKIK